MLLRPRGDRSARSGGRPGVSALVMIGLMIGVVTHGPALAGPLEAGNGDLAQGREKYLAGEYEEALSDFESALVQDPDDPVVTLAVGETLFRLERYEEALAEFERTLSLTDDRELKAEALYNAGTTLLAAGDPRQAAEKLLGSLAVDEGQDDALHNLEVALRRMQEQQQEQQEQQEQDQQDQDDQDKQDQQDQQDQDQQDQQEQEQQDQQEQEQQDQQEQEQQDQQEQQEQQDQHEQQESDPAEDQQEPTESEAEELTQEQALQILKALDRDEEELKRSVQKRLRGGKPKSGKKW